MIDSAIETVLGQTWLQGRLRYNYLDPDKKTAETIGYHENGQLRFCYPILNDKLHGVGRIWHENGVLQSEEPYVNNVLHGIKMEWHPNGQIKKEAIYQHGRFHGQRNEWYENGVQRLKCFYLQDRLNGEYLEWYGNGQMSSHFNFVDGQRHGNFKYGLPDGTLKREEEYVDGIRIPADIEKRIQKKQLTAQDVLSIRNTSVRRICLEKLGYAQFLAQMEHIVIEKDGEYELVRIDWHKREEPICLVKVKCPSTGAFYTLRVPPNTTTIKAAVAWTFRLNPDEYNPEKET